MMALQMMEKKKTSCCSYQPWNLILKKLTRSKRTIFSRCQMLNEI